MIVSVREGALGEPAEDIQRERIQYRHPAWLSSVAGECESSVKILQSAKFAVCVTLGPVIHTGHLASVRVELRGCFDWQTGALRRAF